MSAFETTTHRDSSDESNRLFQLHYGKYVFINILTWVNFKWNSCQLVKCVVHNQEVKPITEATPVFEILLPMLCFIWEDCTVCLLVNNVELQASMCRAERRRFESWNLPRIFYHYCVYLALDFAGFLCLLSSAQFFGQWIRAGVNAFMCLGYLFWEKKYLGPFAPTFLKLVKP